MGIPPLIHASICVLALAVVGCDSAADEADIRAVVAHWNPEFEDIRFTDVRVDDRGETVFSGTAKAGEDLFHPVDYHTGGKLCGVSWHLFDKARGEGPVLDPVTKAGAPVAFDGSVKFREAKSDARGMVTPNNLVAGVWEFRHRVGDVNGLYAGKPAGKIDGFDAAVLKGTPAFDALCDAAKELE